MTIPPSVEMVEVTSSNLKRVGWFLKNLYVEFTDNSTYVYTGVPEDKYNALLAAGSVGKFFAASIRSKYPYEKI